MDILILVSIVVVCIVFPGIIRFIWNVIAFCFKMLLCFAIGMFIGSGGIGKLANKFKGE